MRRARHWLGWGALVVATGCLGGQTGQPSSADCTPSTQDPNRPIGGVTPNAFVAAFEGTHASSLVWEIPSAPSEDVLTIVLRPRTPPEATTDGCGYLRVAMELELSTRDHGLLEHRDVTLSGATGQLQRAWLYAAGERVTLEASLEMVGGEVRISGTLTSSDTTLPASTATFAASNDASGAGGGG